MSAIMPLHTGAFRLSDVRIDARIEQDLYWRWHFADGESSGLQSNWIDYSGKMLPIQDPSLRCGPVYVPAGQHRYPEYEADLSGMRAYHRRHRIDVALARTDPDAARILRLAFRDPVAEDLVCLCPPTLRGPALCNLVELTAAAAHAWTYSRSARTLRGWLVRHGERAKAGRGDTRLLRELAAAADVLLASAGREYWRWRRLESAEWRGAVLHISADRR